MSGGEDERTDWGMCGFGFGLFRRHTSQIFFRFQFYYFLRSLCCLVNNRTNERESILRTILVSALDIYLKLR